MSIKNNDYKCVLIGNSGVGKNIFFKKLSSNIFRAKNTSTIGIDKITLNFKDIEIDINGKKQIEDFNLIIYDTAGQERYRSITKGYYRDSDIIFIIYDITNRKSFDDVESWLDSIIENLSSWKTEKYIITLLGNKLELVENYEKVRQIEEEEARKLCEDKGINWGGELSFIKLSSEELKEVLINSWKIFVKKFGTKPEITSITKLQGLKYVKKKKKKISC